MIYNYISNIEPKFLWYLIVLFAITVLYVVRVIRPTIAIAIALIIGLIVVYYVNDQHVAIRDDHNEELEYKLLALRPRPQYFHMDSNLVQFFWDIREFRDYNRDAYDGALKATDDILKFEHDAEIGIKQYCEHTLDLARDLMTEALNHMHTIIFKTPLANVALTKHDNALNTFHLLLRQHIDNIYNYCKTIQNSQKINKHTQIRYNSDAPKDFDTIASSNFDFY